MNQNTISGNGRRWDVRIRFGRKGNDYFLSHCIRTIVSNEMDKERSCLLGGGAGRSSDRSSFRVIGLSIDRKGLFYLLTLERIYLLPAEDVDLTVTEDLLCFRTNNSVFYVFCILIGYTYSI